MTRFRQPLLLSLLLLAARLRCAAAQASFAVTVDAASAYSAPVPADFVSFSYEIRFAPVMAFDAVAGTPRMPYVNLMRHLASYSGGATGPHIRVGGNSADLSEWSPNASVPLLFPGYTTYSVVPSDLAALAAAVPLFNGSVTFALNFRSATSPTAALALAAPVVAALGWTPGGVLRSLEIGNEPVRACSAPDGVVILGHALRRMCMC